VVLNNGGYGAMRSFSQVMQVRNVPGLDLPGIDYVTLAQSMGCAAERVTRCEDVAPTLARALAHDGVFVIEAMLDSAVPLLYAKNG
jgi:benzoylformate decarboxylase